MRTVHPSIIIGAYALDQDRLPRDEFQIRMAALNRAMDENGWRALLIYGDAEEHAALAYFTHFIPRLRWGMGLIARQGEPRVLGAMSSRDVPAMKLMTWVPDVLSGWNWESAFDPWIAGLTGGEPIDIGSVGFERMRPALYRSVEKSLGNRFRLHAADAAIAACRVMRPRELTQLRAACALVTAAGDAFVEAWRQDGSVERAALAAERRARLSAAQDVRTLVSFDGGRTIAPVRGTIEATSDPLLGYVAVKHMGYWSDMFVAAARRPGEVGRRVAMAMDTLLDAARPGIAARDLHARALKQIIPFVPHPVLGGSIGHRIGLSLNDGGDLTEEASHTLEPGDVYALHIGARDPEAGGAITSAMIAITATGAEILHRSPAQPAP